MTDLDSRLASALAAADASPEDEARWNELDELAQKTQKPDEIAQLYRDVLTRPLPPDVASVVGRRAVRFHEEWFGEESPQLIETLTRVLANDPTADWALGRATVVLTVRERWSELLGLYDRALSAATSDASRGALLEQAIQLAKDFAGRPELAIEYQKQLLLLRPSDTQLEASLERLLERQGRHIELIELWRRRAHSGSPSALELRERIATTYLEHLNDAAAALSEARSLLQESEGVARAVGILERILASETAEVEVRLGALEALKDRYQTEQRGADVERVLAVAVEFATPVVKPDLLRELGERAQVGERPLEALEYFARLLALTPDDQGVEQRLSLLASETGAHARYAEALQRAAERTRDTTRALALVATAADVLYHRLGDRSAAEPLYRRVLAAEDAPAGARTSAARRLVDLLQASEQPTDRLDALESLAALESDPSERRRVLGQLARLAESEGNVERALRAWSARLADDARDLEALDARIELLQREERWVELVAALRQRSTAPVPPALRRSDSMRLASIQSEELDEPAAAVATYREIAEEFGEEPDVVDALAELYLENGQHRELADLLARSAKRDESRAAEMVVRVSDVWRQHLGRSLDAARGYHQALKLDPSHQGARDGLRALIDDPTARAAAVEGLAEAATRDADGRAILDLLDARLELAPGDRARVRLLREAALIHEKSDDGLSAVHVMARAFSLFPDDEGLEREMQRLAAVGDSESEKERWGLVLAALSDAASRTDASRAAHLFREAGKVAESHDSPARALEELSRAQALDPHDERLAEDIVRLASTADESPNWSAIALAIVRVSVARRQIITTLLERAEEVPDTAVNWQELAAAFERSVADAQKGEEAEGRKLGELGRAFETRIATWYRDHVEDLQAAERALGRALVHAPGHVETLRELARRQWREPGRALIDTLLRIAAETEDDLDPLYDAATVAEGVVKDVGLARRILAKLFRESVRIWERDGKAKGERPADKTALFALERSVALEIAEGHPAAAVELLAQGARLPIEPELARTMRRQAGDLARNELGDEERAMRFYQAVADESLADRETVDRLAAMYEARARIPELLALRKRELPFAQTSERKLTVRLEISRLLGLLESKGGRVEMLRENLADNPGHEPSIAEIVEVLEAKGKKSELADLLTSQAKRVEDKDETLGARLWSMVARIAEQDLRDPVRAIAAYRRVVALAPDVAAFDALAKLHLEREEPAQSAEWLEKRLELTKGVERAAVALRLAEARLGAGRLDRAVLALERAYSEDRTSRAVVDRLADLYRRTESYEPLAQLLSASAMKIADESAQLAYVREAAELYHKRLGRPDLAVPVLERGVQLAPEDQEIRTALAIGLRLSSRLPEARALLEQLVTEFGRRRSPERAQIHFQLAQVAYAGGDLKEALEQLDHASSMDLGDPAILKMLGDLAREAGQLDRAERAYRGLLLLVRRQVAEGRAVSVGVAEVLFELSKLAIERGQDVQARELLESAIETTRGNPTEAERLTRALVQRGETELALRTIEARLEAAPDEAARARALGDRADVLERLLDQPEAALEARLDALELSPSRAASDAARSLALRIGRGARFVERVEALVDRMRRREDAETASDLWMAVGDVMERAMNRSEDAHRIYRRVEELGARTLDAWKALARVASSMGDHVEEIRVLRRLVAAGVSESDLGLDEADIPDNARTEALYRIAEVELGAEETLASGLATLREALSRHADSARAARMLEAAARSFGWTDELGELWEQSARASAEPSSLLRVLSAKAMREGASVENAREAVTLAEEANDEAAAERLLLRAAELARASDEGLPAHRWIATGLAEKLRHRGDISGSLEWLAVSAEAEESSGDASRARELLSELATVASQHGNFSLAARTLRRLADADPSDRNLWQPLADAHAKSGDITGFDDAVRAIVDGLLDPAARNDLRMIHADFLVGAARDEAAAVSVLHAVLDEDPDHLEASRRLSDIFEREGRPDELRNLLSRQLDRARDRGDSAAIASLTLRLGSLAQATDSSSAKDFYRQGLEWAPEHQALLRALLNLYGEEEGQHERAILMERLLRVSSDEEAATLAVELADLYALIEDADGVARALELGFRSHPRSETLRRRLEEWQLDRQDFASLADTIVFDADHRSDPDAAVRRYLEAARLYDEKLGRPEDAVAVLERAQRVAPSDLGVLRALTEAQISSGRVDDAAGAIGAALESYSEPSAERAMLLMARARLRSRNGDISAALSDLEEAYRIDPTGAYSELVEALERGRSQLGEADEREATLRLAALLGSHGDEVRSRAVLAEYSERAPNDVDVLRTLLDWDTKAGAFDDVARHAERLIDAATGNERVQAVLTLLDAATRLGRPENARSALERVFATDPGEPRLRDALRSMYEASGAYAELADVLLRDADAASDVEHRFGLLRRAGELLVYEVGDPRRAVEPLRAALSVHEDDADVIVVLADAMIAAGDLAEAVELLQSAIGGSKRKRSPALAMMQLRMARVAGLSQDPSTQLEWLKVALESDKTNGAIAAELAELAMELHDDGTAMNALKVVTLQKTPGPMSKAVAFLRQAQIAHRSGDHQKAVLWARRAKIEDGALREADDFLRGLGEH